MRQIKGFSDLKIRQKLLLGYSVIFILIYVISSTTIYHFVRRVIKANIESELQNSTTALLNQVRNAANVSIKNYLRAVAEKNRDIAANYYAQYRKGLLSESQAKEMAWNIMLSQPIGKTGYIYCLDSDGIMARHPHDELKGVDLSRHGFINEQKQRKMGYVEYDWKNPSETHFRAKALYMTHFPPWDWIVSASSYRTEFKELVNVDDFRDSVMSLKFGKTGYSYVIDTRGNLILHPLMEGKNVLDETDEEGQYFVKEMVSRRTGKITYSWKNPGDPHHREKLVIFNYIPEYDWIVASSSYLDEFYSPLITIEHIFILTVFISLILMLPLSFWISGSITNPLGQLMERFAKGAKGDVSVRMKPASNDEVGKLARYFNTFMERLEQSRTKLHNEIEVRRKAEVAIRHSEARYRELVQNANSIILRVDIHGRITFFNEFAQSFFGYNEKEVMGQSIKDTIEPDHDAAHRSMLTVMEQAAKNPDDHGFYEVENIRRNGKRAWVAWTNKAVRDGKGRVYEYLCVGHDITEARVAEKEMIRMRHYLQNIVDSMPSMLIALDLKGSIILFNREAEKLTGMTSDQALGSPLEAVFNDFHLHKEMVTQAIHKKRTIKTEKILHPAGNGNRWANIMIYPIIFRKIEGVVIRIDDVTARTHMETMMVQTEKMMSVGGLAAGMAHEINNPLGAMVQHAQNIMRRVSKDLKANISAAEACGVELSQVRCYLEQRDIIVFLEAIRSAGKKASEIVDNMLHFSRKSESRKTTVDLADLLDKTIALAAHDYDLKKKYDFRSIRIHLEFAENVRPVSCVATEIEQVILNLLRNAAQAMAGQEAENGSHQITLRLYQEDQMAVIEVQDNGPGMDDTQRNRVFEPFFTTKSVGTGTGLGLSVSYFIITNNHGGAMDVRSASGDGATFIIKLPFNDESK